MSRLRNFHQGEALLQAESGVDTELFDSMVEEGFRPELSATEVRFVNQRTFGVAGSIDAESRPWGSPLVGPAGELFEVVDSTNVRIRPRSAPGDPLAENVRATGELGVLYFEPARRRRAKSLGRATVGSDGTISYRMHRNFGLCNKYIFKRGHEVEPSAPGDLVVDTATDTIDVPGRPTLDPDDQAQLEAADTVFLVSHHEAHGTDPTHRGGPPGFVSVRDPATISMPDYTGNGMFQTLGNLLLDDRIGLVSLDYESGRTLHLTGRGTIERSPSTDPFSERTLVISVEEVRTTRPDIGRWTDLEPFELKAGLVNPGTPYLRS